MGTIRVWAPKGESVDLRIQGSSIGMEKAGGGWWAARTVLPGHGADYGFVVDGGEPLPDPRSPWQAEGIHGPSRVLDHARFSWTDGKWQPPPLSSAVIYELHVGTFSAEGTFEGAGKHLDHLVELGVTHVELMPIAEFSGRHGWGYDGVDLYAPHHAYGDPDHLKGFVDACHRQGLGVLLDVVYNHLGPAGNYLSRFGPYFTQRYRTPWGEAVNLDGPESDEVRRFFIDNALMWLRDYHMDGLRIDAVHAIVDTSAIHFLEQLAAEVRALQAEVGRHLVLIAESDLNDPRVVRLPEVGGYGIDAQWNEDFHHALHSVLTGERNGYYHDFGGLANLAKVFTQGLVYDGCYSAYRRRRFGRPAHDLPGHRFVGCLQNHDQVGNRAKGDRTSHLASQGLLKIGAALVLTSPFIPMIFHGEEWGASTPFQYFTDHQDPDLAQAVRDGRRKEFAAFGWKPEDIPDPQARETFERSRLDWEEPAREPHRSLLEWHRDLIRLRRSLPALADGRLDRVRVAFDENGRWLTVQRGTVLVACNLSGAPQRVPLPREVSRIWMKSDERISVDGDKASLPSESVAILSSAPSELSHTSPLPFV